MVICVSGGKFRGNLLGDNTASLSLSSPLPLQSDEVIRVCLREKGHSVLVLQRMASAQSTPAASSGAEREEAKDRR